MKPILIILITVLSMNCLGQNCKEVVEENYDKVTDLAFSESYSECPIEIKGYFHTTGFPSGYLLPRKIRKQFIFQCTNAEGSLNQLPMGGSQSGDFFVISPDQADIFFEMQKGTKLKLIGKNTIQKVYGRVTGTYFVVDKFEIVELD